VADCGDVETNTHTNPQIQTHVHKLADRAIDLALQHTASRCNTLQHVATHCNALQHTAMHCNTLQHTPTHEKYWMRATQKIPYVGIYFLTHSPTHKIHIHTHTHTHIEMCYHMYVVCMYTYALHIEMCYHIYVLSHTQTRTYML